MERLKAVESTGCWVWVIWLLMTFLNWRTDFSLVAEDATKLNPLRESNEKPESEEMGLRIGEWECNDSTPHIYTSVHLHSVVSLWTQNLYRILLRKAFNFIAIESRTYSNEKQLSHTSVLQTFCTYFGAPTSFLHLDSYAKKAYTFEFHALALAHHPHWTTWERLQNLLSIRLQSLCCSHQFSVYWRFNNWPLMRFNNNWRFIWELFIVIVNELKRIWILRNAMKIRINNNMNNNNNKKSAMPWEYE